MTRSLLELLAMLSMKSFCVPFANYNKMEEKEDFAPVTLMTIREELFYVCCYARKDIKYCKLFLGFIKSKMLERDKETKRRSYTF